MADLGINSSSQPVYIVGADTTGVETTPVGSTADGRLYVQSKESEISTFLLQSITTPIALNKSMLALYNGSASNVVKIKSIKIINNQTTAITGVVAEFRFKRITGLTGGTSLTSRPYDTNDSLASGIISSTTGTVSGESAYDMGRYVYSSDEWGVGTTDVESAQNIMQQLFPAYQNRPGTTPLTLRPGQGLSIKCLTNSTAGNFDIVVEFTQE